MRSGRPGISLSWIAALLLAGCVTVEAPQDPAADPKAKTETQDEPKPVPIAGLAPGAVPATFIAVANRIEPVAEALCRRINGFGKCDIIIAIDARPDLPPNAYQTLDERGRPYVVFTRKLVAMARNEDEIAFVLGHEAGHHIAGHIPKTADQAIAGAILAGVIAQASGMDSEEVRKAQNVGANLGARQFSKEYELQADALGAEIALRAGFDPIRGAAFFDRLPDPGNRFLGTHPPNARRKATVAETVARLTAG